MCASCRCRRLDCDYLELRKCHIRRVEPNEKLSFFRFIRNILRFDNMQVLEEVRSIKPMHQINGINQRIETTNMNGTFLRHISLQ